MIVHHPLHNTSHRAATTVCHLLTMCCAGLLLGGPLAAQILFTETTEVSADPAKFDSRSISFGNYDNDGWPDLFLGEDYGSRRIALLHNQGHSRFSDRKDVIKADMPSRFIGGGAVFGDYDNDGDLDLFVPIGDRVRSSVISTCSCAMTGGYSPTWRWRRV